MCLLLTLFKVREDQEKSKIEEEQLTAQQPGQQSTTEVHQSQQPPQPASYVSPQPNQHSSQMSAQPASQQSLPSSTYNAPQTTQHSNMAQGVSYVPHSTGPFPVSLQGQTVAPIQPESEEIETDKHHQPQHTGGGMPNSQPTQSGISYSSLPSGHPQPQVSSTQTQNDQTPQQLPMVSLCGENTFKIVLI